MKESTKELILESIELSVAIGAEILIAAPIAGMFILTKNKNPFTRGLAFLGGMGLSLAIGNVAGKAMRETIESMTDLFPKNYKNDESESV